MKKFITTLAVVAGLLVSNAANAESVRGWIRGVNVEPGVMGVMPRTNPRWLHMVVSTRLHKNQFYYVVGTLHKYGRGWLTFRTKSGVFEFSVESK